MKRFSLIATCAFLTAGLFSSCQKEEQSALDLAKDLTAELQKITDLKTADSIAPRVDVLNKRLQNAIVRPFAGSATSLQRSGDEDAPGQEGAALQDALKALAKEIGRIQASLPVTEADGEVDRERLILAVGAANGAGDTAPASRRKTVGTAHMKGESPKNETPGNFSEFYGSAKLREALEYTAAPGSIGAFAFEDEPAAVPAATPIEDEPEEAAESTDEPPADDSSAADDSTPAASDDTDDTTGVTDTITTDDVSADDSSADDTTTADDDDGGLPSLDVDTDDATSSDSSDGEDNDDTTTSDSDDSDGLDLDLDL